jgi:hypothetical protein
MSVVVGRPFITMLRFVLISLLAFYIGADDFVLLVGRIYSDIDIGPLTIVGSFAIVLFLGRLFGVVIALLLKGIGYSVRLIPELETDRIFYEDGVDDQLSDHDFITTNYLNLW